MATRPTKRRTSKSAPVERTKPQRASHAVSEGEKAERIYHQTKHEKRHTLDEVAAALGVPSLKSVE